MSDILASVSVVLGAEVSGFKAAMADARRELKGLVQFSEGMRDIGKSLSTYVSLPLAALGTAAVAASAKMESLKKGVEAITAADLGKQGITGLAGLQLAAQQAGDRLKVLENIAKAPGIGFEQAVAGDIRLRAVGISAEQSARSLKEFANAIATTGGGASEFDRVTTQLAQLSAKGKVLSADLRPILEAAPSVSQALLKLYGTIDSETISASLAKQGKSSQDFIAILTDELSKMPRVTGGLANAFENLQQTAVTSAAKLGDGISRALNLPGLTEGLANGIERLGNAFAELSPGTQKLIVGLGVLAAATGPILVAIGTLGAALPALTAGFATLGITSAAALGPIGIGIAAVAVGAALIIDNWSDLTAYFTSGEGGRVFGDLANSVTNAVSQISDAFSALDDSGNFGDLISATGIFKAIFRDIAVGATAISNVVGGLIGAFVELGRGIKDTFSGSETYGFSRALQQAEVALVGIVQPLANVLGFQLRLAEATQGTKDKFDALALATPGLAAILNNLASATPFPIANLGDATREIGLLEQLKTRLKEVQDQRDKEVTVGAIKVDNAEIISLQKQIAALEGTAKGGTNTLAKLREELVNNGNASRALGDLYDYNGSRAKILESGIKSLTDNGFAPGGKVVQQYLAQLRAIPKAIEEIAARTVKGSENLFKLPDFELKLPEKIALPELLEPDYKGVFGRAAQGILAGGGALQDSLISVNDGATTRLALFQKTAEEFSSRIGDVLNAGFADIATGFAESIGQILSGASGLEALPAIVLGAIGSLAVQVGQLAIGTGIAVAGIKAALESLNPAVAIAGGIALVALGTAVKGAAGSIAKGGVGTTAASYSSPTASNYGQSSKPISVRVTGELSLRDTVLVAALRQAGYRSEVSG